MRLAIAFLSTLAAWSAACGRSPCASTNVETADGWCVIPITCPAGSQPSLHHERCEPADGGLGDSGHTATETNGIRRVPATNSPSSKPAVDPMVTWMCTKNSAGACTSCQQDRDCTSQVCELGYCMDCRDAGQCDAAASCVSNRCVPDRKPSSIWTTAGGGLSTANGFKLQLGIGTPSPAATAAATGYQLSVAPGAGNF